MYDEETEVQANRDAEVTKLHPHEATLRLISTTVPGGTVVLFAPDGPTSAAQLLCIGRHWVRRLMTNMGLAPIYKQTSEHGICGIRCIGICFDI